MPAEIAIVEDEAAIAANYRDALTRQGYHVTLYADRPAAAQGFARRLPDLAIIDVGLGEEIEGGFELCRDLRSRAPHLPIMFLTARDSELDVISGLRLGADDYICKGISREMLLARISTLLRRVQALRAPEQQEDVIRRGPLEINRERMTTHWQGSAVELTVTEFWMVHTLARHPGQVKSRQQLMEAAAVVLDEHTVTSHIKRIRRKFESLDPEFGAIETNYGLGYHWRGE